MNLLKCLFLFNTVLLFDSPHFRAATIFKNYDEIGDTILHYR